MYIKNASTQNKNIHFTELIQREGYTYFIHLRMIANREDRGIKVENGEEKEYMNE